ncbi:bactofilin family protein [Marinagarivorans algicola]|uniref:bactofilin family protein n=1 Tax=Marinagarivorans algicola TaxID=1513270 RepID=UPI0006B5BD62|nr:polymer-forming cytoskeletal protein [Marinagarivorans algicola]
MTNPLEPKENQESKSKSFLSGMKADGSGSSSYIGKNIQFRGELIGAEDLHVEGVVDGTVSMGGQNLSIGRGGLVSANIHAQTVLVNGTLQGDVFADDLIEICKTARVQGNLIAPRIKLADGGKFRGTIDMVTGEQGKQDRYNEFKSKLSSSHTLSEEMVNALPPVASGMDLLDETRDEEEELLNETT